MRAGRRGVASSSREGSWGRRDRSENATRSAYAAPPGGASWLERDDPAPPRQEGGGQKGQSPREGGQHEGRAQPLDEPSGDEAPYRHPAAEGEAEDTEHATLERARRVLLHEGVHGREGGHEREAADGQQ